MRNMRERSNEKYYQVPHFRPNSIKVSFKNSSGCKRNRSPFVIFTAPGTPGGYTRMLKEDE